MIQWSPDAGAPVTIPLACDPSIQSANDAAALSAYLATGDAALITVPDDASKFEIRPLTEAQLAACRREAGRPSVLGERIAAEVEAAGVAAADAAEADAHRSGARADARARALEALTDDEWAALDRHTAWAKSFKAAVVSAGLVSMDGGPADRVHQIPRPVLRAAVHLELAAHIMRLSTLGPAGKGRSG